MSYLICANQRSGSTMLCRGLTETGVAGRPDEYFLDGSPEHFPVGQTFWEDSDFAWEHGATTRSKYLDLIMRTGQTPNGIFGAKLMWNNVAWVLRRFEGVPELRGRDRSEQLRLVFPNLRVIHLRRRDRLRQAVSWARAAQQGVWLVSADTPARPTVEAHFDAELIGNLERLVRTGEQAWQDLFDELGLVPHDVFYEDMVDNFAAEVGNVLDHLGVTGEVAPTLKPATIKQADELNDEWLERFLALRR